MVVESQGLELKRTVDNFREISKTACAFANAYGGRIIIGVSDDGLVIGIPKPELDSLQQRVEGAIQQVSPAPFHKITVEEKEGKHTVAIEVYQIGHGAFCTFGGIVYYRAGSQNTKLEGRTLQDYLINRHILSFDESKSQAKIDDIDQQKLMHFIQRRSPEAKIGKKGVSELLVNLGLAQQNNEFWIKNTAVLFFAKEPAKFIPQSEVKLARFSGNEAIDIIDSRFVNSTIMENLKEAEDFIKKNTKTALKIQGRLERQEIPEYPYEVTREALVNAITHRDYFSRDAVQINIFENRLEIINPGTLPPGLTFKVLGNLSVQRNSLTYRLMRDIGFVEGLATGIPKMRFAMKSAGLPEPVFEELGNFFRVTLYNKNEKGKDGISPRQQKALSYLEKNPAINSKTYAKLSGVSHPIAVSDLNRLVKKGIIKKIGKTRGTYYVKKS
ncbi:MAG: ATP-binding protein [Candidatus Micrarchaeota archaeon]